ncbi:MAG: hypothetical protein IJS01_14105 [Lentisphaeria bacterium]|nr:hypothetical protein [Lentisphaeria bacterium]
MELTVNSFGGVLVRTAKGSFAVNGGGSLEEMEKAYLSPEHPLTALILTSEHLHRSRNAALFVQKHHIPLLASFITQCRMRLRDMPLLYCFPPVVVDLYGVRIGLHHIRYDSVDPVFLTFDDGEKNGVVTDGKLDKDSAEKLMDCRRILLCSEAKLHDGMPPALRRRILSVYNTAEELAGLFRGYGGEIIGK